MTKPEWGRGIIEEEKGDGSWLATFEKENEGEGGYNLDPGIRVCNFIQIRMEFGGPETSTGRNHSNPFHETRSPTGTSVGLDLAASGWSHVQYNDFGAREEGRGPLSKTGRTDGLAFGLRRRRRVLRKG